MAPFSTDSSDDEKKTLWTNAKNAVRVRFSKIDGTKIQDKNPIGQRLYGKQIGILTSPFTEKFHPLAVDAMVRTFFSHGDEQTTVHLLILGNYGFNFATDREEDCSKFSDEDLQKIADDGNEQLYKQIEGSEDRNIIHLPDFQNKKAFPSAGGRAVSLLDVLKKLTTDFGTKFQVIFGHRDHPYLNTESIGFNIGKSIEDLNGYGELKKAYYQLIDPEANTTEAKKFRDDRDKTITDYAKLHDFEIDGDVCKSNSALYLDKEAPQYAVASKEYSFIAYPGAETPLLQASRNLVDQENRAAYLELDVKPVYTHDLTPKSFEDINKKGGITDKSFYGQIFCNLTTPTPTIQTIVQTNITRSPSKENLVSENERVYCADVNNHGLWYGRFDEFMNFIGALSNDVYSSLAARVLVSLLQNKSLSATQISQLNAKRQILLDILDKQEAKSILALNGGNGNIGFYSRQRRNSFDVITGYLTDYLYMDFKNAVNKNHPTPDEAKVKLQL